MTDIFECRNIKHFKKTILSLCILSGILTITACTHVDVADLGKEIKPNNEDRVIADISELLTHKLSEHYSDQEKFLRDTHPKANACVHATFSVNADIDPSYQKGVFQPGAKHPVWIRFSNAVEEVTSDYEKDFRGLAMKLTQVNGERLAMSKLPMVDGVRQVLPTGDEDHTQDFLFLGHDAFFAANPKEFFEFFSTPFWRFAITHPRGAWNIFRGTKRVITPLDINWNSVTAYALGEDKNDDDAYNHVVRYALKSCDRVTNTGSAPDKNNEDYLSDNLGRQLSGDGEACFDFYIQRQVDPNSMPVENALVAWPQDVSPFIKIAQVSIPAQVFSSEEQKDFCENMSFNPWHGLTEHRPLGGINRARRAVMKDISDERLRQNKVERSEPTGNERFE